MPDYIANILVNITLVHSLKVTSREGMIWRVWNQPAKKSIPAQPGDHDYSLRKLFTGLARATLMI